MNGRDGMTSRWSRRQALGLGGLVAGGVLLGGVPAAGADPAAAILDGLRQPVFPRRQFDITRFGAVGDGTTDCTDAFRAAVDACHRAGGGRVVVPEGDFLTGAIHLRSNVNLHVTGTIRFHTDPAKYLPVVMTRWEGTECYNYSPLVYAFGQRDVAITGSGVLDGQGRRGPWESWYANSGPQGADQRELRRMGEEGVPVEQRVFGAGHYLRPTMIEFYRCQNVLVSGVTVIDPPMWTVHPVLSRNVVVSGVTVHSYLYNTDGCDPECCTNVHIADCRFDTNDDCVSIKSGRDADGHRVGVPSTNIVVERCKFAGRWGGLAIGSEMSGGVRGVYARDCEINPTDFPGSYPVKYPLYIKTNKLRGGYVRDVHLRNFTGGGVEREALYVILDYNNQVGTRPVDVSGITVEGMVLDGVRRAVWLNGLATDPIRDVRIRDSHFTNVTTPTNTVNHTENLRYTDVTVNGNPIT
ncbi:glycoside hydrolase family 28 protein [Actinophytocola sp.]|uniref:glycoside hydrolase family 28 protein n=1 Tax=Actinophytocola sp. TaxID=1872138 RepID=UPI0038998A6E